MSVFFKLFFLVLAVLVLQSVALPSRIKRQQGFGWEDNNNNFDSSTRPTSRPTRPTTSTQSSGDGGTTTTTASPQFNACIRRCPTTPQYNPVCGSNQVTYPNESHMRCANSCGLNVERAFGGSCQPAK